jgi:predicted amidophosphoribosyltransferase
VSGLYSGPRCQNCARALDRTKNVRCDQCDEAFAAGQAAERAAVVAWLRVDPRWSIDDSQLIARIAEDIERGDHVKGDGE